MPLALGLLALRLPTVAAGSVDASAVALWRRPGRRAFGIDFNVLGLLDLLVAIPLGLLHAPGRHQMIVTEPTTEIMALLPMALIPTFVVPLAIVLHVAS